MQTKNSIIEEVLEENNKHLNNHFETYRNHVYRVFELCKKLDDNQENIEKYAITSVFHDLGIWSDKTFDYLEPSIVKAKNYLIANGKEQLIDEISLMIDMHHKRSKYKGNDWIDVTKGRMTFNINKDEIKKLNKTYPILGFHKFLLAQTLKQFLKSPLNPLPMFKK